MVSSGLMTLGGFVNSFIHFPAHKALILEMAIAVFAKTENLQYSTQSLRRKLWPVVKVTFVFRDTWNDVSWRIFLPGSH